MNPSDNTKTGVARPHAADALVVLGGGVERSGELTRASLTRVRRAVELYHDGVAPRLILTGRCSLTAPDPPVTEAAAMARYARDHGVPADALLLEEEARDTLGNAYFTRELYLRPNEWRVVRVVTSDFHLSRAAWCFRKVLGSRYDFSFVSAASGFTPRELILRSLEECKLTIFLNEWLESVEEDDEHAIERLMRHEHPGYAAAPSLSHDEMAQRIEEIAHINRIAGTQRWLAEDTTEDDRRSGLDRRSEPR